MIDFILLLSASTMSGSLLLLLVKTTGSQMEKKIGPRKLYFLLKISLAYFFIPVFFLAAWMMKMYTYEPNHMPHEEITGYFTIHYFNGIAIERQAIAIPIWTWILFGIWLTGAIVISFRVYLYKRLQLCRLLKSCTKIKSGMVLEVAEKTAFCCRLQKQPLLYQSPEIISPFLFGIFHLKMVVPQIELTAEEWEMIFLHEYTHYKSKDILFRQTVGIIQGINWFNPLIYCFTQLFQDYGELACDEKVSRRLTEEKRGQYARLLVKLAKEAGQASFATAFSNSGQDFFKRRILIIMRKETLKKKTFSAVLSIVIAGFLCPVSAYASTYGALAIHNEIAEWEVEKKTTEETYIPYEYVEKVDFGEILPEADVMVNGLTKGANTIDFTLAAGKAKTLTGEKVTAGKGIKVAVFGEKTSDQFVVGIIEPSGSRRSVASNNGEVSYTFDIEKTGTYKVYFENTGNSSIHFSGIIYVNY